jgi:hypothetical protein
VSFAPIFTTLKASASVTALIGSSPCRCYPQGEAPQDVAKPYVTYQQITGSPENYLGSTPNIDGATTQVDVYGATLSSARAVFVACRNALEAVGYVVAVRELGRDPETNLYRVSFDHDAYMTR